MPYIKPEDRDLYDPLIAPLRSMLGKKGNPSGDMNYVITKLILGAWKDTPRYDTIARIDGVLRGVSSEFYRRVAAPYEDKKIAENGDVYGN